MFTVKKIRRKILSGLFSDLYETKNPFVFCVSSFDGILFYIRFRIGKTKQEVIVSLSLEARPKYVYQRGK